MAKTEKLWWSIHVCNLRTLIQGETTYTKKGRNDTVRPNQTWINYLAQKGWAWSRPVAPIINNNLIVSSQYEFHCFQHSIFTIIIQNLIIITVSELGDSGVCYYFYQTLLLRAVNKFRLDLRHQDVYFVPKLFATEDENLFSPLYILNTYVCRLCFPLLINSLVCSIPHICTVVFIKTSVLD